MSMSNVMSKCAVPSIKLVYYTVVALFLFLVYFSTVRAFYIYNIKSIDIQIENAALNSPDILNPPMPDLQGFCSDFAEFRSSKLAIMLLGDSYNDLSTVAPICSKLQDNIPYSISYKD